MIASLMKALTSRAAGPVATATAAALAVVLGVAWSGWDTERTALEARVAELSQQAQQSQSVWKARLAACHASGAGRGMTEAAFEPGRDGEALLSQAPEGIDACARMESADHAVLSNLK